MKLRTCTAAAIAVLSSASLALAWWSQDHPLIAEAAVAALPADMPEFFRKGAKTIASYSADPDLWKEKELPAARAAEGPNHYINPEGLQGRELPRTRPEYVKLCRELKTDADVVGCLPYALEEGYEKLALAFAEHRKSPEDKAVQAKILYLAGILAHYTGDAEQPLHTTIHHDGRAKPDGTSPKSGIHIKMDALPEKLGLPPEEIAKGLKAVEAPKDVFTAIQAAIEDSRSRIDRVYELEAKLPDANAAPPKDVDPDVRKLGLECCRAGARFTAMLWYAAWVRSAEIKLPEWHKVGVQAPVPAEPVGAARD